MLRISNFKLTHFHAEINPFSSLISLTSKFSILWLLSFFFIEIVREHVIKYGRL